MVNASHQQTLLGDHTSTSGGHGSHGGSGGDCSLIIPSITANVSSAINRVQAKLSREQDAQKDVLNSLKQRFVLDPWTESIVPSCDGIFHAQNGELAHITFHSKIFYSFVHRLEQVEREREKERNSPTKCPNCETRAKPTVGEDSCASCAALRKQLKVRLMRAASDRPEAIPRGMDR